MARLRRPRLDRRQEPAFCDAAVRIRSCFSPTLRFNIFASPAHNSARRRKRDVSPSETSHFPPCMVLYRTRGEVRRFRRRNSPFEPASSIMLPSKKAASTILKLLQRRGKRQVPPSGESFTSCLPKKPRDLHAILLWFVAKPLGGLLFSRRSAKDSLYRIAPPSDETGWGGLQSPCGNRRKSRERAGGTQRPIREEHRAPESDRPRGVLSAV
jgi:hypothetical protein